MSAGVSLMWGSDTWTDPEGIEHQRAGYIGCLCGWTADIGKSIRREFDKHILKSMSKGAGNV